MFKKSRGVETKLNYLDHVVVENRNELAVNSCVNQAYGTSEREAALLMREDLPGRRIMLGADKNYDVREFTQTLRQLAVTPHVEPSLSIQLDRRTNDSPSRLSAQPEKTQTGRGNPRVAQERGTHAQEPPPRDRSSTVAVFQLEVATYDLVRIRNLTMATTCRTDTKTIARWKSPPPPIGADLSIFRGKNHL